MTNQSRKSYIVLCEGASEVAYITELSKFLQENDINISFTAKNAGGGQKSNIEKKLKEVLRQNKNKLDNYFIFLDKDIYIRNPKKNTPSARFKELYYFNTYCFEDFLVLHLDKPIVIDWYLASFQVQQKYFNSPDADTDTEISELLESKQIFRNYKKGELPPEIKISLASLRKLVDNCNDPEIKFKSDFVAKIVIPEILGKFSEEN